MRFASITLTLLALACGARAGGPAVGIPGVAGIGGAGGRFGGAGGLGSYGGGYGPGALGPAVGIPGTSGIGAIGGPFGGMGGPGSYGIGYGPGASGGQAGLGPVGTGGLSRPTGMGQISSPGGFIPGVGAGGITGAPQPYNTQYQAHDGQGGVTYRRELGDASGAMTGSYGYTDAQGLYRFVEYVADGNGFRAKVQTNEPGVDGKENPADVEMHVEQTPYGIQEQYTPVQGYGTGGTGSAFLGGYGGISGARPGIGGISGARPGIGGIYPASAGIGGIGMAGQGSSSARFPAGLGTGRPATPFGVAGPAGTGVPSMGAGGIRPTSFGGAAGLYPVGAGGSGALGPQGGASSPFGSIPKSTSKKSSY